jgi:glucose dehydrogenase
MVFFYVVDRNNGKLQNAFPFVDNITWASHIDLKTGRPVENVIPKITLCCSLKYPH